MKRVLALVALGAALLGCSPAGWWGSEARYAPDLRGYVIEKAPGSARHVVLMDPVAGTKIRCREALQPFLAPLLRSRAAGVRADNQGLALAVPTTLALAPLTVPGSLFLWGGGITGALAEGLYRLGSSPSADSLYDQGARAFAEKRWSDAERHFELARLASRDAPHALRVERASYSLGLLYEREGRTRDAARAFSGFLERATIRDAAAYDEAERRLAGLEPGAIAPCRSQAPVALDWSRPGAALQSAAASR